MHESRSGAEGEPRTGFEDFVRAQYHALVRFLRRRNSIEDAEEIAQESIISLMQYREKGQVSDWRPLLYRIATHHATKRARRSEEHTSELQSLMRISYAVFCSKQKQRTHS